MPIRHPERAEQPDYEALAAKWREPRRHERLARFNLVFVIFCSAAAVIALVLDTSRWWSWSLYLVMGISAAFQARDQFREAARLRREGGAPDDP